MAEPITEQESGRRARDAHAATPDVPPADVAGKAAHENFPVAFRLVPRRYRDHLMAVYVYARTVDDIGDQAPPADRQRLLAEVEQDVERLFRDNGAVHGTHEAKISAVRGLSATVRDCGLPMQPLVDLIRANQQDQVVTRYQTFDDLTGYCELSANPVGRIVLHVFGCFDETRARQSDMICTGLQLAEHWQDVGEDLRAGRIYLPLDDLAEHGCAEADLAAPSAGPAVRKLMAAEVARANELIDSGAPLVGSLRGAARAAVAGYVAGGRAALAAIAAADYDVLAATRRPGRARTLAELLAAYVRGR
jgi:squalene synthase HpnC